MTKFFGFLLGIAVALALPATFGVLAADGGIELNTKGQALAYGIGALVFWGVVSRFAGAAALGAALAFGTMIYAVHYIPNRTTNFLNEVPGVTTGMIDGLKTSVLSGVVPILAVIALMYAIQLIVGAARRRRLGRAEEAGLAQEQALAAERDQADVTSQYPVSEQYPTTEQYPASQQYPPRLENRAFSDLYDDPYRDLHDEGVPAEPTTQFAGESPQAAAEEQTAQFEAEDQQYSGQYRERMDEPDTGWDLTAIPAGDAELPSKRGPDQPATFRPLQSGA